MDRIFIEPELLDSFFGVEIGSWTKTEFGRWEKQRSVKVPFLAKIEWLASETKKEERILKSETEREKLFVSRTDQEFAVTSIRAFWNVTDTVTDDRRRILGNNLKNPPKTYKQARRVLSAHYETGGSRYPDSPPSKGKWTELDCPQEPNLSCYFRLDAGVKSTDDASVFLNGRYEVDRLKNIIQSLEILKLQAYESDN